jgi:uncharacterized membrane protein
MTMEKKPTKVWHRVVAFLSGYVAAVIAFSVVDGILASVTGAQPPRPGSVGAFLTEHGLAISRLAAIVAWILVYVQFVRWIRRKAASERAKTDDALSRAEHIDAPAAKPIPHSILSKLNPIKRGILFGAAFYLIGGAVWVTLRPDFEIELGMVAFVAAHAAVGAAALFAGIRAPPGRSSIHTIVGALLGIVVACVAYVAIVIVPILLLNP